MDLSLGNRGFYCYFTYCPAARLRDQQRDGLVTHLPYYSFSSSDPYLRLHLRGVNRVNIRGEEMEREETQRSVDSGTSKGIT